MNLIDTNGHRVSGANSQGLACYEQAANALLCMVDDPVASVASALAASPTMTMAHVLNAWLHLLGTDPGGDVVARASCDAAAALDADDRERAHIEAARALAAGRWREAGLRLEDLSIRYPRDSLALQVGHQIDFFRGDSRMLRDRIARALTAWDASMPGWHALLGMHAFGLEETGDYAAAEAQAQRAVELQPRDSWAWHAMAHVHEMRNAPLSGIAWLEPNRATWAEGSFLATHNTWHLALFHLELDHQDEALRLFDEAIGLESSLVMDLLDATSMLWRLQLCGVDVGNRFEPVAERWAAIGGAGQYAFNDWHAMMAYTGAGQVDRQTALLDVMRSATESDLDNADFTRWVGLPAARAVIALGQGDARTAVALLREIRSGAHRFGGSHAQRDLIDQLLLEAAVRSGDGQLAGALAAERKAIRPRSVLTVRSASNSLRQCA